jgi:endonuclease/exonuclease/phosphatase family metal-dependent hydrolase
MTRLRCAALSLAVAGGILVAPAPAVNAATSSATFGVATFNVCGKAGPCADGGKHAFGSRKAAIVARVKAAAVDVVVFQETYSRIDDLQAMLKPLGFTLAGLPRNVSGSSIGDSANPSDDDLLYSGTEAIFYKAAKFEPVGEPKSRSGKRYRAEPYVGDTSTWGTHAESGDTHEADGLTWEFEGSSWSEGNWVRYDPVSGDRLVYQGDTSTWGTHVWVGDTHVAGGYTWTYDSWYDEAGDSTGSAGSGSGWHRTWTEKFTTTWLEPRSGLVHMNGASDYTAVWAVLKHKASGKNVMIVDAHPQNEKGLKYDKKRKAQVTDLIAKTRKANQSAKASAIIYAGDFNSNWSREVDGPTKAMKAAGYVDADVRSKKRTDQKFNSWFDWSTKPTKSRRGDHVDHIYTTTKVAVKNWRVVHLFTSKAKTKYQKLASDHAPVRVTVTVK